jgi:hypothetical protein
VRRTNVPRKKNQDGSQWDFSNVALEALLCLALGVAQHFITDLEKILAPHHGRSDFLRRVGDRAPHLFGDLFGELILAVIEQLQRLLDDGLPV